MCSRAAVAWAWFVITLALLGVSRFTIVFYTCRGVWMTTLFRYVRHAGQSVRCCAAWRSRRCTCRRSTYLFRTGGGSNKLVGVAFGAEAIAEVVAAPVSGWATDRFRRDKVLKLSAFIGLLGTGFAVVGFATESTIVCVVGLVCWGVFRGASRAANSQPLVYRNHWCTAITASRVWSVALGDCDCQALATQPCKQYSRTRLLLENAAGRMPSFRRCETSVAMGFAGQLQLLRCLTPDLLLQRQVASCVGPALNVLYFALSGTSGDWDMRTLRVVMLVGSTSMCIPSMILWAFNDDDSLERESEALGMPGSDTDSNHGSGTDVEAPPAPHTSEDAAPVMHHGVARIVRCCGLTLSLSSVRWLVRGVGGFRGVWHHISRCLPRV